MKSIKWRIMLVYALVVLVDACVLYYIIPILLNYGEGTVNTAFDQQVANGLYYYQQILLLSIGIFLVFMAALAFLLRDIDKYKWFQQKYLETNDPIWEKKLLRIKRVCFNLPNLILVTFITLPVIIEIAFLFAQLYVSVSDFKLVLVIFIIATLSLSLANIYVKKVLKQVLIDLENTDTSIVKRRGLTSRILLQILPIITVCIVFTFLMVSAVYEQNNGLLLADYYNLQFKYAAANATSGEDLITATKYIQTSRDTDILFVIDNTGEVYYSTGHISEFFQKYINELSSQYNYRVYDYYGTYGQGVVYPVSINGETWYIGAHYLIYSSEMFTYISCCMLILFIVSTIILTYFVKELTKDINSVAMSLKDINTHKDLYKELYITSTDELGDLIAQYNKVKKLTKTYIDQIHHSQDILVEKERLATLGQMIGGIAHNLKTPIMSIAGANEGLMDLIKEYEISIGDPSVTSEDHHAIANEMKEWVEKVKSHVSYMSDVITAVKGQAVTLSDASLDHFTVDELIKRVDILMKHELKNALINLKIDMKVPRSLELYGNINSLVQVINNMISNAIQSYNGITNNNIDLAIYQEGDYLVISIRDYGAGMSNEVKNKLFKSMITTKGKNGTGLGLFMSYSNIKAHFNGDIIFESKLNEGTVFYIKIPLK